MYIDYGKLWIKDSMPRSVCLTSSNFSCFSPCECVYILQSLWFLSYTDATHFSERAFFRTWKKCFFPPPHGFPTTLKAFLPSTLRAQHVRQCTNMSSSSGEKKTAGATTSCTNNNNTKNKCQFTAHAHHQVSHRQKQQEADLERQLKTLLPAMESSKGLTQVRKDSDKFILNYLSEAAS